ncbi:hypothetical protein CP979_26245 [Streptomyces filamentosus]|nr:hypothetical protein CP979_26245 [Streptomyces filamentosus]
MASERLTFTLEGRDDLSRVLGHAGESAQRLQRTMQDASDDSGQAILTLTGMLTDASGTWRDVSSPPGTRQRSWAPGPRRAPGR